MEPRIKEGAMRWQRHLVSRNPRKSGPRKGSLILRLIRRRKELHLNLNNTVILHRSYSSHLSSRNLGRYANASIMVLPPDDPEEILENVTQDRDVLPPILFMSRN